MNSAARLRSYVSRVTGPARELAGGAGLFARAAYTSGLAGSLRPSALPGFVPAAARNRGGPHLAVVWHAHNQPEALAVCDVSRRLSYGELDAEANQLAHALAARDVRPGDGVALVLANAAEHIVAQQALARLGASAVQVGARLRGPEIAHIFDSAKPALAIADAAALGSVREAIAMAGDPPASRTIVTGLAPGEGPEIGTRYEDAVSRERGDAPPAIADARHSHLIIYTSGTTGKPKGAKRSLRQTGLTAFADLVRQVGIRRDDRHLVVCPLYHSGAVAFTSLLLSLGASLHVRDRFDPEAVLADVERHRLHSAFVVPTMLVRLLELPAHTRARYDTSSLRWIVSGAAPLAPETASRFQDAFGDILWNFYGSTETGLVTLAGPQDHRARPGTIGRPLHGNEIRLAREDGSEAPPGEVGELFVKNAMLIAGYHRNDAATRASMRDGYFSVGDLARQDDDGYVYLVSRVHDMVISGGVNIYPREIEDRLHEHPAIAEAAVVGRPDPEWGEVVEAYVAPRTGQSIDPADVEAFCRQGLAGYKCPRRIEVVDSLPRSATGKVVKSELVAKR